MFSQCPDCSRVTEVSAPALRSAMGMLRCPGCGTVFNALAALRDDVPQGLPDSRVRAEAVGLIDADPGPAVAVASSTLRRDSPLVELADGTSSAPQDIALLRRLLGQTGVLALRNILRHRRRAALGLGAIASGIAALLLAAGFSEWMIWIGREAAIHSRLGHIQIVKPGYHSEGIADPRSFLLPEQSLDTESLASMPKVRAVGQRANFTGLVSRGETTLSFMGEGVTPASESVLAQEILVHAGQGLSADAPDGVLLGKGLARNLGAAVGDALVLLGTGEGGKVSAAEARVRGIFHTAVKAYDDVTLRVPLGLAQKVLGAPGVHQWLIVLDDTAATAEMSETLSAALPPVPSLEVVPWTALAHFQLAVERLFDEQTRFINGVIALIIIMSISNLLAMSVLERTPEIGTLMALGFRRGAVMRLFIMEGFMLGALGGVLGLGAGWALASIISEIGIPMPPSPGMDHGFIAHIRLTPGIALTSFAIAVSSAVLASLYPAFKASRLEIVDALRRAR
jgi:putative ABC transport system permease protein